MTPARSRPGALLAAAAVAALAAVSALGVSAPVQAAAPAGRVLHVAPDGSDRAPGSAAHPLRTIGRCTDLVRPGDTCLIHAGRYREQVTPPSGTAHAPVTLAAAGDGAVVVDGTEKAGGWRDAGGGLVAADVRLPLDPSENALFLDGERAAEGRWPNAGADPLDATWAVAERTSTSQHIDDPDLPAGTDWTGATVHLWAGSNPWAQQTGTVTASGAGTLDFKGGNHRCTPLCMGDQNYRNYYLVGAKAALDQPGEWYYDHAAHRLYMVPPKGGMRGHTVTAKYRAWGVDLRSSSYVNVRGLSLWGTSLRTGDDSRGVTVSGLRARYVSEFSTLPMPADSDLAIEPGEGHIVASRILDSGVQIRGHGNTLRDSEISDSAGTGVLVRGDHNTVTNSLIHDVGWMGSYTPGIEVNGSNQTITHNTVRRTGRSGIDTAWQLNGVPFHDNRIAYNDLSEGMRSSRDGSSFYVCCNLDASGTSVDHNTTHDHDGQIGYYVDNSSANFLLHHNVAWNIGRNGSFFNAHGTSSTGNRDQNSSYGEGITGPTIRMNGSLDASGTVFSNNIVRQSIEITGGLGDPPAVARTNLTPPADPLYEDARNGELWLKDGSPAIDAGETIDGVTGSYRGAAPDQGAYEYGDAIWSSGCSLPGCTTQVRRGDWKATSSDGSDASAAVDGQTPTRWTAPAAQRAGQSLTLDLGTAKTFDRVVLDAGLDATGQAAGWTVAASDDGTHFGAPLATVGGGAFAQDATFAPQTARFLRFTLTADGSVPWQVTDVRLYADGPDAASPVQAERAQSGPGTADLASSGALGSGDALGFRSVAFGAGADRLSVRLAADRPAPGTRLELRLGSPHGRVVATLPVPDTGGADTWRETSLALPAPLTGTHDVYLVAPRGGVAVDWWKAVSTR
ncbi:carbohydrate-binding protein [Streptomyces sp. VRA16 Mangrove soil]|uniref:carbohydrate-binding protein n=1 Tax=Streptomyces sp. VRA16 Mangrove soil TaxID=2817434 RepID=UPI001A9EFECB|nr:carbohydrate-binding protein [Streptomyces sp. VRA16 Mangrove soil]MBO1336404.1 carbohydrate-binding protein [Streptomyces sp. VRA16 Mangrove soil]